ncbi:hypothetical protein GQ600_15710 [Phytophthora cactorum]|nr:hypothetical protein GQ600_15710 [Phytophthora cactorum]
MRHWKRSTTAKPLHASGIQPKGSTTNWEKARDVRSAPSRRKKQVRGERATLVNPKKITKKSEKRRRRGRKDKAHGDSSMETTACSNETPMDKELKAFAARVALSSQEKQLRKKVFEDVRDLISSAFQDATVQLYGSSSTGLDTFRSDLDITVGNITLSSQPMPSVVVDEEEFAEERAEEEESSFSLNLALPVGTVASEDNADITRRVQPTAASHWNPTLRRRKLRVLRALQFLLKSQRPHFQLSIDIGVNRELFEASEHGRSTSLVHKLQNTLGAPFTTMIMFLKEFLHQFELDKPFTGGLGSFRLYMMVAYIFQRNGFKHKNKPDTQLPLPLGDGGHMDFGGVFRIDDCVETFAMAFDILGSTGNIGSIIYEERLEKDRRKVSNEL